MDPIASFIQGHDRFVISTHISPEGDAVGSALAVQLALERLAKRSQIVMRDPVPRNLEFLPGAKAILSAKQLNDDAYEQVILVDCATSKRVGPELYDRFKGRFLINIDHHCDNPRFGNLHHISDQASATMVVADLLKALQIPLDRDIATCLYAGLLADTNGFRNANVNAHVLATAAPAEAGLADGGRRQALPPPPPVRRSVPARRRTARDSPRRRPPAAGIRCYRAS